MYKKRQCSICGSLFQPLSSSGTRCPTCRTHKCEVCGSTFIAYSLNPSYKGRYCSVSCYFKGRWGTVPRTTTRICRICGESFKTFPSDNHLFCSARCGFLSRRGKTTYPLTTFRCDWCGKDFQKAPSARTKALKFCSRSCMSKWQTGFAPFGPEHPRWKGGYASPYGTGWQAARQKALDRSKGICELCHKHPVHDVHHRLPVRFFRTIEQAHFPSNLVAICRACHGKEARLLQKSLPLLDLLSYS